MEMFTGLFGSLWHKTKSIYNIYTMLFGIGAGCFSYFVDGTGYDKKGLKREGVAARITGAFLIVFAIGLYILIKIF